MLAHRLVRDTRGNVAIIFALLLIPLIGFVGLSVDYGHARNVESRLQQTLDAVTLNLAREDDDLGDDVVLARARQLMAAAYPGEQYGIVVESAVRRDGRIQLLAHGSVPTTFAGIIGMDTVKIAARSEVAWGGGNLEVALILDTTGSMAGQRIADLREAAAGLVNVVVQDDQDPFYSKVALVPYSLAVNLGGYADSVRGPITPPVAISGATTWSTGNTRNITGAAWSSGSQRTITGASWSTGTAKTITGATRANPVVVTSNNHGFQNGDVVWLSGVGGMTQLNNRAFVVAGRTTNTFQLQGVDGRSYGNFSSGGTIRKCQAANCAVVVTASYHGFDTNDYVRITGVNGMTQINNADGETWQVTSLGTSTFALNGSVGPTYGTYSSGGRAIECRIATCEIVVTTSSSHGFGTGDTVFIWDVDGMREINGSQHGPWQVTSQSSSSFSLNGAYAPAFDSYSRNGTVQECRTASCEVQVTASGHGLATGDYVYISGVRGMTQINNGSNETWRVTRTSADVFTLNDSASRTYSAYTSGGTAACTAQGCQYFRFDNASSGATRVFQASTCVSERTGAQAFTDAAPSVVRLGANYASPDNPCPNGNVVVPLTSDRAMLNTRINALQASGSTGGHVGVAWGWYMLSPNFSYLWPSASQPAAYGTPDVTKIAVLMTDGEYNSSYCSGVISRNSTNGSGSTSDHINCDAPNGSSFYQAEQLCASMKAAGVTVFTVGFDVIDDQRARDLVNHCATDAGHVYIADNGTELIEAFTAIGAEISQLRISQ